MSLRRKVLFVFTVVNLLTLVALVGYGWWVGDRFSKDIEERAKVTLSVLKDHGLAVLTSELRRFELHSSGGELELALFLRNHELFDGPIFRQLVGKGVVVRLDAEGGSFFNLPRSYIFDAGELDRQDAVRMVRRALADETSVMDGRRLAAPLRAGRGKWGFYLRLSDLAGVPAVDDRGELLQRLFLIVGPGLIFLFCFLWISLTRSVIAPLESLSRVARAVSHGDYSRRLPPTERKDEIGRVTRALNRMLELIDDYRQQMEARIEEKTAEIERKRRELMLGQRLAATGTLASGIAHEINNPLGGMLNAVVRLRRGDMDPERTERYFDMVEEGIQRIGAIVQQVLSVSPRKMVPTPINLAEVLRRSADLVEHRATQAGVAVELELEEVPPILGESNEIGQIFLNLFINAVDACTESDLRQLHVRLRRDESSAIVDVSDTGPGMSKEVASQAFDLFFTTKDAGRGTGLGLATVHHLVEAHGGSITFETDQETGSLFRVRLPFMHEEGAS